MKAQQWLIDTNVVSEIRKAGRANANVLRWAKSTDFAGYFLSLVLLPSSGMA
jgi:predicted nucleic acid-binding protein